MIHERRFTRDGLLIPASAHRAYALDSSKDYKAICWNQVEARRLVARFQSMTKMAARADRKASSRCPSWATTLSA